MVSTIRADPGPVYVGGIPLASPERSVADTTRLLRRLETARAVVADAVQRGICDLALLCRELEHGPRRGSALLRIVLAEVSAGARSAPEAQLLAGLRRAGLPVPAVNVALYDGTGQLIAVPDFCWTELKLVVEVDSREWHLSPQDWQSTMRRHNRLTALGYTVLHFPPSRIRDDLDGVTQEIAVTLARLGAPAQGSTR